MKGDFHVRFCGKVGVKFLRLTRLKVMNKKMKLLLTILLLVTASIALVQTEINQRTEKGQKKGKWVEYYENGKIKEINYYEPAEKKFKDKAHAFFHNYPFNPDSIIYYENLVLSDIYEYKIDGEHKRIKRIDSTGTRFLYGANQEIELKKDPEFKFYNKISTARPISINLENKTNAEIHLRTKIVDKNNTVVISQNSTLKPRKETEIQINLKIETNENKYDFILENDSIKLSFPVWTFGYHININENCDNLSFKQNQQIIYYRPGSEALLKIFDKKKEIEFMTVSLAREITYINLNELQPDNYLFCTIDFSTKKEKCCIIKIEK